MPRIRYTEGPDELQVLPAGQPPILVKRGEWVEVSADIAGKAPTSKDLGTGLLAQGWEADTKSTKREKE